MALLNQLQSTLTELKTKLPQMNVYDFGSFAVNYLTPKKSFKLTKHVAYGLKSRQRLDLYQSTVPRANRPLMLFVHGGAWQSGDKKDYLFVAESFCSEGFDVAVMNYHLAPEYIFPESVNDVAVALNFLHLQQHKLGILYRSDCAVGAFGRCV